MNITIRQEMPADHRANEILTREAFWGYTRPDCDEHYLVHIMRSFASFLPQLAFVAEAEGRLAGNIFFTRANVVSQEGEEHPVLTFGPLSVHPDFRNRGVGQALMYHAFDEARSLGHSAVVIYGHPDYYPRVGFRRAAEFGITSADGKAWDAHMALPLVKGGLDGVSGRYFDDPGFEIRPEEAAEYDRLFPPKAPAKLPPISLLLERLPAPAREGVAGKGLTWLPELMRMSGREVAALPGMDAPAMEIVNATLREHGYPPKRGYHFA